MKEYLQKLLSLKIKHIREECKLNQEKFSEMINVDISTISNIENNKVFPSFETACKIMYSCKLEPNDFLDCINYKTSKNDILNLLILEHLKNTPVNIKQRILDLLVEIDQ